MFYFYQFFAVELDVRNEREGVSRMWNNTYFSIKTQKLPHFTLVMSLWDLGILLCKKFLSSLFPNWIRYWTTYSFYLNGIKSEFPWAIRNLFPVSRSMGFNCVYFYEFKSSDLSQTPGNHDPDDSTRTSFLLGNNLVTFRWGVHIYRETDL